MSRVHCPECAIAVVVDPSGLCPDGHTVGAAGARIATAMASATPSDIEPEPWVAQVVLEGAGGPAEVVSPRTARPIGVAVTGGTGNGSGPVEEPDADTLLRELTALSDLGLDDAAPPAGPVGNGRPSLHVVDGSAGVPEAPQAADTSPTDTPADDTPEIGAAASASETPTGGPRAGAVQDLDELTALEAALHDLGLAEPADPAAPTVAPNPTPTASTPPPPAAATGAADANELDELFGAGVFSDPPEAFRAPSSVAAPEGSDAAPTPNVPAPKRAENGVGSADAQRPPTPASAHGHVPDGPRAAHPPAGPTSAPPAEAGTSAPPAEAATSAPPPPLAGAPPAPPAPGSSPTGSDAAPGAPATPDHDGPPAPGTADTAAAPGASSLDLANFTAKGARSGRKRRFGR